MMTMAMIIMCNGAGGYDGVVSKSKTRDMHGDLLNLDAFMYWNWLLYGLIRLRSLNTRRRNCCHTQESQQTEVCLSFAPS